MESKIQRLQFHTTSNHLNTNPYTKEVYIKRKEGKEVTTQQIDNVDSNKPKFHRIYNMGISEFFSNRVEELRKLGFGLGIHAYDDYDGNKTVVGDDFGFLHGPSAPFLRAIRRR